LLPWLPVILKAEADRMPFVVPLEQAKAQFPQYTFVNALTPSEQKAAFHVKDAEGRDLCLKIIAPNYEIARLHREIRALQSVTHPNVAQLREYTLSSTPNSERHYLVEDFITGTDLGELFNKEAPWSPKTAADCFAGISEGLDALHKCNIVHRDLKPTNVRVRSSGEPVIIDFGLARHLDLPDLTKTEEGAGIGTPLYFAPEQFSGSKHDIDHRTDLFAVGVMLYQAITGKHPFWINNMSRAQLAEAVCTSEEFKKHSKFTALAPKWQLIISRLLAKDRISRVAEASQLARFLKELAA
jgi:serine/threonine protein kinase